MLIKTPMSATFSPISRSPTPPLTVAAAVPEAFEVAAPPATELVVLGCVACVVRFPAAAVVVVVVVVVFPVAEADADVDPEAEVVPAAAADDADEDEAAAAAEEDFDAAGALELDPELLPPGAGTGTTTPPETVLDEPEEETPWAAFWYAAREFPELGGLTTPDMPDSQ
jgi:hypothetical protein